MTASSVFDIPFNAGWFDRDGIFRCAGKKMPEKPNYRDFVQMISAVEVRRAAVDRPLRRFVN